jgi:hypothetical protein
MDELTKQILEQINLNLNQIGIYINKITKKEISIDSAQIYLVDYSIYKFLNKSENQDLKDTLLQQNKQVVQEIINNDFARVCTSIYVNIETLLNKFIAVKEGVEKVNKFDYYKKSKLYKFIQITWGVEPKELSEEEKYYYYTIRHIMDIRDVIFHGEYTGKSIEERIEAKGKSMNIYLKQLDSDCNEEKLITIFSRYLMYPQQTNQIRISKNTLEKNYAYIYISNLKLEYLDINTVINDIKANLNTLRYQLGEKVYISSNDRQPENDLYIFFKPKIIY